MKKNLITLIAIITTFNLYSQITLEHQITGEKIKYGRFIEIDETIKYAFYEKEIWTLNVYNSDNSIYTIIPIDISSIMDISEYDLDWIGVYAISETLFDLDTNIEFLISFDANQNVAPYNHLKKTIIIDDNGSILFNVSNQISGYDDENELQFPSWISNTDNGTKMILYSSPSDGETENIIYIYSLPGTIPALTINESSSSTEGVFNAHPNPANEYINIDYNIPDNEKYAEIVFYNNLSQEVKRFKVDNRFNSIKLNTADLKNGVYFYNIQTDNYKSDGKKLIIKK